MNRTKVRATIGVTLLYLSNFLNALLREYSLSLFMGSSQLPLQLEALLFCLSIILGLSTTNIQRAVKFVMTAIILLALINVVFAGLNYYGKVEPLYPKAIRGSGHLRYSGLFDYPSRLGILCAIVFSWMFVSSTKN